MDQDNLEKVITLPGLTDLKCDKYFYNTIQQSALAFPSMFVKVVSVVAQ